MRGPSIDDAARRLPAVVVEGLAGRRVAVLGFPPADVDEIVGALALVRARAEVASWPPSGGRAFSGFDLLVAASSGDPAESPWLRAGVLADGDPPVLLVGEVDSVLAADPAIGANQILLAPWRVETLLVRAYLALHRPIARPAPGTAPGPPEVLVADDDPTILALLEATLRQHGFRCRLAADGEEAIELAARLRPAAVIVDVNMPRRDGYEVLSALRADRRSAVPVVLLTARNQETDILRAFDLGASEYVVKPFHPLELVARLRRLLAP